LRDADIVSSAYFAAAWMTAERASARTAESTLVEGPKHTRGGVKVSR
jgi:hypothetical protein